MPRGLPLLLSMAALIGGAAYGDTAKPSATTATYGAWTVGCGMADPGNGGAAVQLCQMKVMLNLKGQDGQMRPLLQMAIGTPPGSDQAKVLLQLPTDVALRDGVSLSLDKTAKADANGTIPQVPLADLTYLACGPQACAADGPISGDVLQRLAAAKSANVTFTMLAGAQKIMVPVSLDGFADALAALQAKAE